jgi:hypothetical protein
VEEGRKIGGRGRRKGNKHMNTWELARKVEEEENDGPFVFVYFWLVGVGDSFKVGAYF